MKINVVIALVVAASAIGAPSKKPLECKPHEEVKIEPSNTTALVKGFLMIDNYHREMGSDGTTGGGGPIGTLQPSDGKMKVSTLSEEELKKNGKQFQLMSCNAKGEEYHDKKLVPGRPIQNSTVVRGQLKTGDKCLAVKDGDMQLEKCATTEEELKGQIFTMSDGTLENVHGENTSTLIVDVKDGAATNVREWKNESHAYYMQLSNKPIEDQEGLGHDGAVPMRVMMAGMMVALAAAWVLV